MSYSRLRDLILADILAGVLRPGEKLKVSALARRYGSSTIPVREGLQQLQGEGVVVFEPNRGASVRAIDARLIEDIHDIRAMIEPYLMQGFVRRCVDTDIDALDALQRRYDTAAAAGDFSITGDLNRTFHAICYDGHHNGEAVALAYRHSGLIRVLSDRFPMTRARAQHICREHWAIIGAARRRDEEMAARLVSDHVRNAGRHLIETMRAAARREVEILPA